MGILWVTIMIIIIISIVTIIASVNLFYCSKGVYPMSNCRVKDSFLCITGSQCHYRLDTSTLALENVQKLKR